MLADPEKRAAFLEKDRRNSREYYYKNHEKQKAYGRQRSQGMGFEGRKLHNLQMRFGLTLEQYQAMHDTQKGLCAICNLPETTMDRRRGEPRMLAVDHNHATGKIRGLLCGDCNKAIGAMREKPENFLAAVKYLETHAHD